MARFVARCRYSRERASAFAVAMLVLVHLASSARAQQPAGPWMITVLDESTGQPIQGAEVRLRINDLSSMLTTDASGKVSAPNPFNARFVSVSASAPKRVPMQAYWNASELPVATVIEGFTLKLPPGQVTGGILKDDQGTPIGGADVFVTFDSLDRGQRDPTIWNTPHPYIYDLHLLTDAQGRWTCDISPSSFGSVRIRTTLKDFYNTPYGATIRDTKGLADRTAVLTMSRGVRLAGIIRDTQGRPVAGAEVSYDVDRGSNPPGTASAADGSYVFEHARPDDDLALLVRARGLAPQFRQVTQEQVKSPIDVTLQPATPYRGRVVDSTDAPLPNAHVLITGFAGVRMIDDWEVQTDDDGRFVLEGSDAEISVDVLAGGGVTTGRDIELSAAHENLIRLQRRIHIVGTIVDDQTGLAIPDGRILVSYHSPESPIWQTGQPRAFRAGIYDLTIGEPGPGYLLKFDAEGYHPLISRVIKPDEAEATFDARMTPGSGLSGVVRTPDGHPAVGASVIAAPKSSQVMMENDRFTDQTMAPRLTSSADGVYQLPPQVGGDYYILATHESGYLKISDQDLAKTGREDLVLQPWAIVEGILKIGAKPAAGMRVGGGLNNVETRPGEVRMHVTLSTTTDEQGHFRLRVPPNERVFIGRYLELTDRSYTHTHSVQIDAKPGQTTTITIGGTGRPVVGKVIVPDDLREHGWSASLSSLQTKIEPVGLPLPANAQQMTLEERRAWLQTDEGKAYSAESRRLNEARKYYAIRVEPDGTFRVEDVEAGTYDVQIRVYPAVPGQLLISSGQPQTASATIVVEPMEGGRSDTPLEIPPLELASQPPPRGTTRPAQ